MAADGDGSGGFGELLIRVAKALGASETKMRWRVQRFHNWRQKAGRRSERRAQHIGYEHKKCPSCRAINDKNEKICSSCGGQLSWRVTQMIRRAGWGGVTTGSAVLIAAMIAVYVVAVGTQTGPFELRELILRYSAGAKLDDHPLAALIALLVNPSLLGLVACAAGIFFLGTELEELYGRLVVVALFMLVGALGVAGHHLIWPDKLSLGATPGLVGLIGIGLGAGHIQKSHAGRELRGLMIKWAVCVIVLLLILAGNIVAELIAMAAGIAIGLAVKPALFAPRWRRVATAAIGIAALAYGVYEAITRLAVL